MATHDYVIDNSTGANVRADLNLVLQAILSNNSSSSAPSTTAAYMWWADTTTGILKIRNSANNAWVELLQLDGTLTLEDGSASTPALAFRDDLNTGIFSSAADTFNVATGGVERMELGAATVFNEDGADVDFRIEGDSDANNFYLDASTNRIGIGQSVPEGKLHIENASSGATFTPDNSDILIIENSDSCGIDLRSPAANSCGINFSDTVRRRGGITYSHSTDAFSFLTAGSVRATLDSSGNVGIGTTSPVFGSGGGLHLRGADGGQTRLHMTTSGSGDTSTDGFYIISLGAESGGSSGDVMLQQVENRPFRFGTNNTERMRIDSTGRLLVGRTSNITSNSVQACHVVEQITDFNWTFGIHCAQTNKVGMTIYYSNTTNNLDAFRFMVTTSTKTVISGNGNISNANNSYGSVSDVALKENIVDANSQWNDIKNIKVRNFNFKESTGNHGKTMIGVVAQEIETVSPKLVYTNDDGYKEVSYTVLYMKAIKALQEAITKIEVLETKVAALEAA